MLEMSLYRERGSMVIEDLRAMLGSPLIVAEGSTLPASAVSSGIAERSRGVWLIPTTVPSARSLLPTGRREVMHGCIRSSARSSSRKRESTSARVLSVDGSKGIAERVGSVERLFGEALAAGSRAEALEERQALLRETNEAIAAQVRGYYTRPWAEGDAEAVVRRFVCECGDQACDIDVHLPVG
jgi:hypothetical protein